MKVILVELPDEARHVAVLEVLRQDGTCELFALIPMLMPGLSVTQDRINYQPGFSPPRQRMYHHPCPILPRPDVTDPRAFCNEISLSAAYGH